MSRTLLTPAVALAALLPLAVWSFSQADSAPAALDPDLAYQAHKLDPVTYDVDFQVAVTPPYHTKVLKVWLPLPQTDAGQEVTEGALSAFPTDVKPRVAQEPRFGNRFAYFEIPHPEGAQIIRHSFQVKSWELRWNVDADKVQQPQKWPNSFGPYLRQEDQAVVVTDQMRKLLQDIVPQLRGPARDMAAVMAWMHEHLKYDHDRASLQASAEHALKDRCGHCSDYHGLCAAFGRALGYPTRVTYGINPFPKNSPSHCKLEVFLPPYGWVSFDVSETQRLIGQIRQDGALESKKKDQLVEAARRRLASGFRDNTWFLQTRGTDYDLAPPAARKVVMVRTIYAEADGVALPEPDPANSKKREFSWMTAHRYKASKEVSYPFASWKSLQE